MTVVLAHPLTEAGAFGASPLVVATFCGATVAARGVALAGRTRGVADGDRSGVPGGGPRATATERRGRLLGLVTGASLLLATLLAIAAGVRGNPQELRNIAPSLVLGAGWPGLLVAAVLTRGWLPRVLPTTWVAVLGGGSARALGTDLADPDRAKSVWPAAVIGAGWAWYLSAFGASTDPRVVAASTAAYLVATALGAAILGPARWLGAWELFGVLCSIAGRVRRRELDAWSPPSGADVLVATVFGGALFYGVGRSRLWLPVAFDAARVVWALAALVAMTVSMVLILRVAGRRDAKAHAAMVSAAVPGILATAIAAVLDRAVNSLALLILQVSDPFGVGLDLLGTASGPLRNDLVGGRSVHVLLGMFLVIVGHLVGVGVLMRRVTNPVDRRRGLWALSISVVSAGLAVTVV